MRTASFLVLALALALAHDGRTAAQPKKAAVKPLDIYAKFRSTLSEGKYDVAGIYLDEFLKSNPQDSDFLKLEEQYGTTVFQQLRTVPRYSDDPATEKKVRADIEELNARATAIATKLLYNPARVNKYIRNLGESYEEKVFAQQELKRTGGYAVPFLIEAIRTNPSNELYAGILETIPVLEGPTMAGWVAALDTFTPDRQYGVLTQLAKRRDVLDLITVAQTDFTPYLWRVLARPRADTPTLHDLAEQLLNRLLPGAKADARRPEAELTAAARTFYEHKARYLGAANDQKGNPTRVPVWVAALDGIVLKVTRLPDVPVGQAEEYYGLRYARWALEIKPDYAPAQSLVLALAAERAVERSHAGNLAVAEPAVYKLLADAPSRTLIDLLARGLTEKRTALVLAMVQVLGDRADREAATPPAGAGNKPSLLVRALGYPDPAVQFAAATALLRSPVPVPTAAKPRVVEILRRAAATDPGKAGGAKGTVLLADPGAFRAGANALLLRGFGFDVEVFATGRDLLKRIARASDFDLIFIDRHTANPELIDLIAQVEADARTAGRPVFVIASADRPRLPTFDQLLLRTAELIAATENDVVGIPAPYIPDPLYTAAEQAETRRKVQEQRDAAFRSAAAARTARLMRVTDTLPLTPTDDQKRLMGLRVKLITYAILAAEFPLTAESAPEAVADLARTRRLIAAQPPSADYGTAIAAKDLAKLIERYEIDVAKVKGAQEKYDFFRTRVDPVDVGIPVETFRDPALEARLRRLLTNYPAVRIIPEPYSRLQLEPEFQALAADPAAIPRDAGVKAADARAAVEYLRQMAVGDLPGYDYKLAADELRAALNHPDPEVASAAVDAVERFKTGDAQAALLRLATKKIGTAPVALRRKAADAAIRHIRANGKAVPPELVAEVVDRTDPAVTPDAELRAKFLTLKGMLAFKSGDFTTELKGYNPPIIPPEPKKEPEPKPKM